MNRVLTGPENFGIRSRLEHEGQTCVVVEIDNVHRTCTVMQEGDWVKLHAAPDYKALCAARKEVRRTQLTWAEAEEGLL